MIKFYKPKCLIARLEIVYDVYNEQILKIQEMSHQKIIYTVTFENCLTWYLSKKWEFFWRHQWHLASTLEIPYETKFEKNSKWPWVHFREFCSSYGGMPHIKLICKKKLTGLASCDLPQCLKYPKQLVASLFFLGLPGLWRLNSSKLLCRRRPSRSWNERYLNCSREREYSGWIKVITGSDTF